MIDDWKQWAQEFLFLLKEAENAEQEGKTGDTAEQSARRKELEVELTNRTGLSGPANHRPERPPCCLTTCNSDPVTANN